MQHIPSVLLWFRIAFTLVERSLESSLLPIAPLRQTVSHCVQALNHLNWMIAVLCVAVQSCVMIE